MSHQQRKYKIFVNYFIQNDSWESINQPNLFVIPDEFQNLNDVKAQIIYDNFPLISHFNYYLRFYLNDKTQGVNGWIDYPPNATVPVYNNGHVYVKALRIPKNIQINFKNSDLFQKTTKTKTQNNKNLLNMSINDKNDAKMNENKNKNSGFVIPEGIDFGNIENNLKENKDNKNMNNNMNMNNMNMNMNNNNMGGSPIHKQNTIPKAMNNMPMNNNNNNNMNLNTNNNNNPNIQRSNTNSKTPILLNNNTTKFQELNLDNIFSSNTNNNNNINLNNNNNNNNLNNNNLNNNIPFQPQQKRSQSPKLDSNLNSINFNIPIDTGNSSDNNNNNSTNQTFDFTSSIKSKYPIDNVPNTLPEDDIKERVDKIIREWTMGVNEKKSLLFLITTLHEVWTNDPKLETPQMQILVNDKTAVRTYYKKAMRILHSDKNKDKDFKTRYIAESLYQILNEANAAYN
jgi:hypothetical protein